jgi:hypothetical protein
MGARDCARSRQNNVLEVKKRQRTEVQKKKEEDAKQEAKRRIIVGVEEKDRAFGRTLRRSRSQSDRSPFHFVADLNGGRAAAVADSLAVGSCHRAKWSLYAGSSVVMYNPLMPIRGHSPIRCHSSCTWSCSRATCRSGEGLIDRTRCRGP